MSRCVHHSFASSVTVNRLEDIGRFVVDVTVACSECGVRFRFIGLPSGVDLNGAATNADGTEARLAIAPAGEVVSALEGAPQGFTMRRSTPTVVEGEEP